MNHVNDVIELLKESRELYQASTNAFVICGMQGTAEKFGIKVQQYDQAIALLEGMGSEADGAISTSEAQERLDKYWSERIPNPNTRDAVCYSAGWNDHHYTHTPTQTAAVPDEAFGDEFEEWWEEHGQYVRSGGGYYEKTFAFAAFRHLMPEVLAARRIAPTAPGDGEIDKAMADMVNTGTGIMKDGKHVPLHDFYKEPESKDNG